MRTYTIKFKDKERGDLQIKAYDVDLESEGVDEGSGAPTAYNFIVADTEGKNSMISVAWIPFTEVLAIVS